MVMSKRVQDALEDCLSLPAIPNGYIRVLASDGGIHDVPAIRFKHALEIDPRLSVLPPNPLESDDAMDATSYPAHAPSEWQ